MSTKFEQRFAGRDNAGLRARIREQVRSVDEGRSAHDTYCDAILALARTVALTPAGLATLRAVAADYSDVAAPTRLVSYRGEQYTVSDVQARLIERYQRNGMEILVRGASIASARALAAQGLAALMPGGWLAVYSGVQVVR